VWWQLVLLSALLVSLMFGYVLLFGAPYLPTTKAQIDAALRLAGLPKGGILIDLGCGDGRILIAAAEAGYMAVGYELNPLLFAICWLRTRRLRTKIKLIYGDFWHAKWPAADAVYVFLLGRLMDKLERKIRAEGLSQIKIVSFAFRFNDLEPLASDHGVYLYKLED
jgi:SAM-dependent methyltransferase